MNEFLKEKALRLAEKLCADELFRTDGITRSEFMAVFIAGFTHGVEEAKKEILTKGEK